MRVAIAVAVMVTGACGRVGFDPRMDGGGGGGDGGDGGDGTGDGAVDAIVMLGPFGVPSAVPNLAAPGPLDDPTLAGDMLEMIIDTDPPPVTNRLYRATRTSTQGAWSPLAAIPELDSGTSDAGPELLEDGLTLMFSSTRGGGLGGSDIWMATRTTRAAAWTAIVDVPELSSTGDELLANVTPDGLTVYLTSSRSGNRELYVATRSTATATWSTPQTIPELDSTGVDSDPDYCAAEDTLYFSSDRDGTSDIYRGRRQTPTTFDPPELVTELNTAFFDGDPWLSPDCKTIFFTTDRGGGLREVWTATR